MDAESVRAIVEALNNIASSIEWVAIFCFCIMMAQCAS